MRPMIEAQTCGVIGLVSIATDELHLIALSTVKPFAVSVSNHERLNCGQ